MVFLKEFLEKVDYEKKSADTKKHEKLPNRQRVNAWMHSYLVGLRDLLFGQSIHLIPNFMYASSEASSQTVCMY